MLGQERDGIFLFSWVQSNKDSGFTCTRIGLYSYEENELTPIYSFNEKVNCIQASVNSHKTILAFVVKESNGDQEYIYKAKLYRISDDFSNTHGLQLERSKQIMVQFLYPKQSILLENQPIKFLIFIHQESKYTRSV